MKLINWRKFYFIFNNINIQYKNFYYVYKIYLFFEECNNFSLILKKIKKLDKYPIEYLLKQVIFYNKCFFIKSDVHIPKECSEKIVEYSIKYLKQINTNANILELYSGSGVISFSLSLLFKKHNFTLVDFYKLSIDVTKKNINIYNLKNINIIFDNVFNLYNKSKYKNLINKFQLIIANPPYILDKDLYKLDSYIKSQHIKSFSNNNILLDTIKLIYLFIFFFASKKSLFIMENNSYILFLLKKYLKFKNKKIIVRYLKDYNYLLRFLVIEKYE